ncbi:MAG: plastocyanin/azurin family copper-binding protein [Balneolaceae bacterium]
MRTTNIQSVINSQCVSKYLGLLILVLAFTISACGDSSTNSNGNGNENGGGNEPPPSEEPGPDEVWMEGTTFTPSNLEVEEGTTVTWTNQSSLVHTVTSGDDGTHDGEFDSGDIAAGGEYSYTFNDAGTYEYFCRPHVGQGMTGTITVTSEE